MIVTTQPNEEAPEKRMYAGGTTPCVHPFFGHIRSMAEQLPMIHCSLSVSHTKTQGFSVFLAPSRLV